MKSRDAVKYTENLKHIFQMGAVRQLIFMLGLALSVALGIVLFMSIKEPMYRPLDYKITAENMSLIVDSLEKANIDYKMDDKAGVILVPAKDLQQARIKLSGVAMPKDDNFNYAFLNEQNGFSNSQFIDSMRYLHALENDLAKTINAIEGISGARVHIAVPRSNVYADENNKVTASVVLNTSPGVASNHEKIHSIMQILADSVPGLDPKDIAITDQYGHFLSDSFGPDSIYNAAQLNYQNNIQSYYEKRIEGVINPILGENKTTVRVNANIDFTQQEDAQEQFDPDKKVVRSEQTSSEQSNSGGASGAPGSLSNSPPDGAKASGGGAGGEERTHSKKNYAVTKTITYKKSNFAKVRSLSVAVVIDNIQVQDPKTGQWNSKPLPKDMSDKINELVKATIGFDEARGDKVTVVNASYMPVKESVAVNEARLWEQPWFWDTLKRLVGIGLGFGFLLMLYRKMAKLGETIRKDNKQRLDGPADDFSDLTRAKEIQRDNLLKLKQLAATDPTRVASVIKNWVGKN